MTRNNKIIAGAIVLAAGVATYMIGRKRRSAAKMSGTEQHPHQHTRHVTGVFARAKNQAVPAMS